MKQVQTVRWAISCSLAMVLVVAAGCDQESTAIYITSIESTPAPATTSTPPKADASDEKPAAPANEVAPPKPSKQVEPAEPGRLLNKTFDDIKFDIEPDAPYDRSMLTDEIEELVGKRIRIRGWMYPTFQRSGITDFVLVRDNQECCFGPGAALYDCIVVNMVDGASADFSTRSIAVEGTFSIDELIGPNDRHMAVFHLDGEKVE